MKNKTSSTIALLLLLSIASCLPDPNKIDMDFISEKINTQVAEFIKLRAYDCRNKILISAESHVDSIMSDTLRLRMGSTISFPARPITPAHIGYITLDDTFKIKPFLDLTQLKGSKSTTIDSLKN